MTSKEVAATCREACMKYSQHFFDHLFHDKITCKPAGIFPSEAMLLFSLLRYNDCNVVVESGRKHGYSTEVFIRMGIEVHSYEQNPLSEDDERLMAIDSPSRVVFHYADSTSRNQLINLVQRLHDSKKRIGVFLDGPKGRRAIELGKSLKHHVAFFSVHDCSPKNPANETIPKLGGWVTTDEAWSANYGWMDKPAWEKDYTSREEVAREAFGLGVVPGEYWKP